jgi:hypothetical protein
VSFIVRPLVYYQEMNVRNRVEQVTIIIVTVLATALSIVDTFGLYRAFPFLSWAAGITPSVIVVLLTLIAIYLVLERRSTLDKIAELMVQLERKMGGAEIEILDMKWAFPQHIAQRARAAKKFILDTNLTEELPRASKVSPQEEYSRIRDERVLKGEIGFKRVEIIFHKERLESIICRLLMFEGCDFYLRHYDPPPQAIPIIHLMSFDDEHFYIGGFYPLDFPPTEEKAVYIRSPEIGELLREYWQLLWLRATPLNEGGVINWTELERIGSRLGLTNEDFESLVARLKKYNRAKGRARNESRKGAA